MLFNIIYFKCKVFVWTFFFNKSDFWAVKHFFTKNITKIILLHLMQGQELVNTVTFYSITLISNTFKNYLFHNSSLKPRNGNHSFYQRSFFFFTYSENTTTKPSTIFSLKLCSTPTLARDPTIIISVFPALIFSFLPSIHFLIAMYYICLHLHLLCCTL